MTRVIAIVSGKGGVGKTTLTANLGVLLASLGKKVLVVDADVAMANLTLLMDLASSPITLHDVLAGEAKVHDAVYDYTKNLRVIPSGLSFDTYTRVDLNKLKSVIDLVRAEYDYILLDCPAGVDKGVIADMAAADEVLIIVNPTAASVADALKAKIIAERIGVEPIGAVVNLVKDLKGEIPQDDVVKMLELPVLASIPDDPGIRREFLTQNPRPVTLVDPTSPAVLALKAVAARLAGIPYQAVQPEKKKEGFFKKLLGKIFKKK